jgi:hypothetical protein
MIWRKETQDWPRIHANEHVSMVLLALRFTARRPFGRAEMFVLCLPSIYPRQRALRALGHAGWCRRLFRPLCRALRGSPSYSSRTPTSRSGLGSVAPSALWVMPNRKRSGIFDLFFRQKIQIEQPKTLTTKDTKEPLRKVGRTTRILSLRASGFQKTLDFVKAIGIPRYARMLEKR